jgi:hypothetical protein
MSPPLARTAWIALCCACSAPAFAQYEVEEQSPVTLRALLDVRAAYAGPGTSWTDGGPGKTRYGGRLTSTGFERDTHFDIAELALEFSATLPGGVRAQAQANIQPDVAGSYEPWLIEANLRKEWGGAARGWGVQGGLMNVPFSLEHVGPAWSPDFALSASALNAWLWEDTSLAGLEGEWWRTFKGGIKFDALVGVGYGPDQLGRLLALRGWVIGDQLGGWNGDLQLPNRNERTDIFHERDDRPAAYAWVTVSDEQEVVSFKLGYFNNNGDQDVQGVWHTQFTTAGVTVHPVPSIDIVAQYLSGTARVLAPPNDSSMRAFYALVSHKYKRQRITVRYDSFVLHDLDGGPVTTRERGEGVTVAYLLNFGLRHRVGIEYTSLNSRRPASVLADPSPDGVQLSYRFRY